MSIAPVVIEFMAKGTPQIQQSIRGVAQAAARAEAQRARDEERAARARVTTAERAAKAQERTIERSARERARIHRQAVNEVERIQERAHRSAVRQIQLETRERERASIQWVRMREREMAAAERANRRITSGMLGAGGRGVVAGGRRVGSVAIRLATTAAQLGGGFSLSDSVGKASRMAGLAADIANSAWIPNGTDEANKRKRATSEVLNPARAAAIQYGLETETTLGGLQKFVGKSGDLDTALRLLPQLAELSRATGASFEDVADAAGDVVNQLANVPNKGEAVMAVMRGIAGQGKLGAVEMRDLASQMAKLAAAAGQFGGDAVDNILKMGMLAQGARQGGGAASAAMAATSVMGFTNTLKTPARLTQFKALGIEVFDPKTKMLNAPEKIIQQSIEKTKGDPEHMKKLFANVMGERAITNYANIYRKAEVARPGSGKSAVQKEMDRMLSGATMSKADVARAASDRMREADARMMQIREQFDQTVSQRLLPKLIELAPAFEKLLPQIVELAARGVPAFADLIKTVADFAKANEGLIQSIGAHPIGAIIAFEVTKSIGAAMIGETIKRALLGAIGGGGGSAAGAATGVGPMGAVLTAGAVQIGTAYGLVANTGEAMASGRAEGEAAGKALVGGTPEEQAAAQRAIDQARKASEGGATTAAWGDRAVKMFSILSSGGMGAIANYGTEYAIDALGGKSTGTRATEALKGEAMVKAADDTVGALGRAAIAADNLAGSLGRAGSSGPNGTARSEPILNR